MTGQRSLPVMLVTGASRGIGAAIARLAAAAGYTVVVNYAASADMAKTLADQIGNESFAVRKWQGTQEGAFHDRKDRGVCTDAERERQNGDDSECG